MKKYKVTIEESGEVMMFDTVEGVKAALDQLWGDEDPECTLEDVRDIIEEGGVPGLVSVTTTEDCKGQ